MRSIMLYGAGDARVEECPKPKAGPEDVVVEVKACGICGTDIGFYRHGHMYGPDTGMPIGHEFSGVIHQTGKQTGELETGMRVVVNPMSETTTLGCGSMDPGGFSDYVLVREARLGDNIFTIPDSVSYDIAALAEPFSVGMHAVRTSGAKPGDKVTVFGGGPIGLGVVSSLIYLGITDVLVLDCYESRLALAKHLGAEVAMSPQDAKEISELIAQYQGATQVYGMPAAATDVYIDAAGVSATLEAAISAAKVGAKITVVALHHEKVATDWYNAVSKGLQFNCSLAYDDEFPIVVQLLAHQAEHLRPLISHHFSLPDFNAAMAQCAHPDETAKVIINAD